MAHSSSHFNRVLGQPSNNSRLFEMKTLFNNFLKSVPKTLPKTVPKALVCFLLMTGTTFAATQISLILGPLKRSVDISELHHLAKTGQAIGASGEIIRLAKLKPAQIQEYLNANFEIELTEAADFFYSTLGNGILTKIGHAIHPAHTDTVGAQALRSAFIMSSIDGSINILEVLDQYPTNSIWIDLEVLPGVIKDLGDVIGQAK